MSSYRTRAEVIRDSLARYEKTEFIAQVIRFLNEPVNERIEFLSKRPNFCFRLIEWRCQAPMGRDHIPCDRGVIYRLLAQVTQLEDNSTIPVEGENFMPQIGRLLNSQLWFQQDEQIWMFQIPRYRYLLMERDTTGWFEREFEKETGVALNDCFIFSLLLTSYFRNDRGVLSYGALIKIFVPYYSVDYLYRILCVFGCQFHQMSDDLSKKSDESIRENSHFRETVLLDYPIILNEQNCFVFHKTILMRAVGRIALSVLAKVDNQGFRLRYTRIFEDYVMHLCKGLSGSHITESEIKQYYNEKKIEAKNVDLYITESEMEEIFLEVKGVEPKEKLKTSASIEIITDSLKKHISEAILQAYDTKRYYSSIENSQDNRYLLIVVNEAFPFCNGIWLKTAFPDYFEELFQAFEGYFVPGNIFIVAIDEMEGLSQLDSNHGIRVVDFLRYASGLSRSFATSKHQFRQFFGGYSEKHLGRNISPIGSEPVRDTVDKMFFEMEAIYHDNDEFWVSGKGHGASVNLFIQCFNRLIQLVNS